MAANQSVVLTIEQREWIIKQAGRNFRIENRYGNMAYVSIRNWQGKRIYINIDKDHSWISLSDSSDLLLELDTYSADIVEKLIEKHMPKGETK